MLKFTWTREPKSYSVTEDKITVTTLPHTDLWQRTYYHFRNDNAPVFQMETEEKFYSFVVKTDFADSHHRFDQCGVVMYLDSENWLKGSIEYENEEFQHLGSVVTNHGYSDWATTEIPASVKSMWYRLSRREDDYCIECSDDGNKWKQMRVCHMHEGAGKVRFGIYACSPEDSSFTAEFTNIALTECAWKAHDGQKPDEETVAGTMYREGVKIMSRKDFGAKPFSYPQPVWIIGTYDENGKPNAMNAAWGGISEMNEVSVCLSVDHKTCKNFEKTGAFTISMADADHVAACDFVGLASGNKDEDKFAKAGFTATKSPNVNAPIINELAVCMECKVKSFDHDSCILKGEIVNVSVDETALTEGKVDVNKVKPITFDPFNNAYHVVGEKVGDAWGSGKALM